MIPIDYESHLVKVEEILRICRLFPELAVGSYSVILENWREVGDEEMFRLSLDDGEPTDEDFSILQTFLYADVGLPQIEALCDLLAEQSQLDEVLEGLEDETLELMPIHVACRCAKDEIIVYLARKQPDLLFYRDTVELGRAFQYALDNTRHPPSVDTLKLLLQLYPGAVVHAFALSSKSGQRKINLQVLEEMVHLYPTQYKKWQEEEVCKAEKTEGIQLLLGQEKLRLTMDLERTKIFCQLLSHLQKLCFLADGWEEDAFVYFMQAACSSAMEILSVSLPLMPQQDVVADLTNKSPANKRTKLDKATLHNETSDVSPIEAFQLLAGRKDPLKHLAIQLFHNDTTSLQVWLNAVRSFSRNNMPQNPEHRVNFLWRPGIAGHELGLGVHASKSGGWDFSVVVAGSDFVDSGFVQAVQNIISTFNPAFLELQRKRVPNAAADTCQEQIKAFTRLALNLPKPLLALQIAFVLDDMSSFFLELQQLDCKLQYVSLTGLPDAAALKACLTLSLKNV